MVSVIPTGVSLRETPDLLRGIFNYFDSFRLAASSAWASLFVSVLGEEQGQNISLIDGACVAASSVGLLLLPTSPAAGVALVTLGSATLSARRGPNAGLLGPLVLVTAIKNPTLGATAANETFKTLGEGARAAVQLGFEATGLLVTASGAIVGIILTTKKK